MTLRPRRFCTVWLFGLAIVMPTFLRPSIAAAEVDIDKGRRHWAFQRLRRPTVPAIDQSSRRRTDIDAFVLAKLEQQGLHFSPDAQRPPLLRRIYLDLIGLPPDPAEMASFVSDSSGGAYERAVDRLLQSPHFGERWGRHWLDMVGYVEAIGFDVNAELPLTCEGKWRYRDYVIRSLNQNKPMDRFVTEQLAGDEMVAWRDAERYTPEIRDALIATGYWRTGQDFTHEPESNIPLNYYMVLQNQIEILGSSLLGLTLNCVQCHTHKYEPIPQEDYYRLMAVLTPAYHPQKEHWRTVLPFNDEVRDRTLPNAGPAEQEEIRAHNGALDAQIQQLQRQIAVQREACRLRLLTAKRRELRDAHAASLALESTVPRLDGLAVWLRADQGVYADDAAEQPAEVGEAVALWKDQLVGDNQDVHDARQSEGQFRPVLIDRFGLHNARALRFDNTSSHFLRVADHPRLRPRDGLTIIAVYRLSVTGPGDFQIVSKYDEGVTKGGNWGLDLFEAKNQARFYFGDVNGNSFGGAELTRQPYDDNDVHLVAAVFDAGQVSIRFDQQASETTPQPNWPVPSPRINDSHTAELLIGARGWTAPGRSPAASNFLPGEIGELLIFNRALSSDEITPIEQYLRARFGPFGAGLSISDEQLAAGLNADEKDAIEKLQNQVADLEQGKRKVGKIQALWDVGPPPVTHLHVRGDFVRPGDEVDAGFLRVLSESHQSALIPASAPNAPTSGRRLALARWLTDRDSRAGALVARVMVNRVWQNLFGQGLVPTPNNFGMSGTPPTHPELLEWLAVDFVDHGWDLKRLIKQMMMSTVYRQESVVEDGSDAAAETDPLVVDPENQLLWRMRLRRLESEVIRDSVLAISGTLDRRMGGESDPIDARADGMVVARQASGPAAGGRRSVYLLTRRTYFVNIMSVFDSPIIASTCVQRDRSAVPLQSLTMLNDAFVLQQVKHFANRVRVIAAAQGQPEIETAYQLALSRGPDSEEIVLSREFFDRQVGLYESTGLSAADASQQALADLCHTLINTSEFLYIP